MVDLHLSEADVDLLLLLINRKIEKANEKEIDEIQVQYVKDLTALRSDIEAQISY